MAVKTGTVATPLAAALAVQTLSLGAAATASSVRRARRRPADCPFFASQRYWLVAGAHACVFGSFKVFEQFSSAIFVQRFSYDVRTAGLMASSVPLLSAVLAPYAGKLADRASMAQRNFCTALALHSGARRVGSLSGGVADPTPGLRGLRRVRSCGPAHATAGAAARYFMQRVVRRRGLWGL